MSGAFAGLQKIVQKRLRDATIGFAAGINPRHVDEETVLQNVQTRDFVDFGFEPEFIGRLPMVTVLAELTESQLVAILTETRNALTKQYAKLMAMEGVELEFSADALRELAAQAIVKVMSGKCDVDPVTEYAELHAAMYRGRLWVNQLSRAAVLAPRFASLFVHLGQIQPSILRLLTAKIVRSN